MKYQWIIDVGQDIAIIVLGFALIQTNKAIRILCGKTRP